MDDHYLHTVEICKRANMIREHLTWNDHDFEKHFGDCLILDGDGRLYLQEDRDFGDYKIHLFGGRIETGETPEQGMMREILEETGGFVGDDRVFLGSVSEDYNQHKALVHVWFWYDRERTITGCYEREPMWFNRAQDILEHSAVMEYTKWAVQRALDMKLLP